MMLDLKQTRTRLKRRRAVLTPWQQHLHAQRLNKTLKHHPFIKQARHIGLYWPVKGEADARLINHSLKHHQRLYLPILAKRPQQTLHWIRWTTATRFKKNKFNIPEPLPDHYRVLLPQHLDCVLVPLLGFGSSGQRLGMGGGFYDRSFAFINRNPRPLKPILIGIGYEFQKINALNSAPWDVRLNCMVTESGIRYFI